MLGGRSSSYVPDDKKNSKWIMDLSHSMPQRLQNVVKKKKTNKQTKRKQRWCADY